MTAKIVEQKIFSNTPGPLPLTAEVLPLGNTLEVLFSSGSCYTHEENQVMGFQVLVNGEVAAESKIYSHTPHEHRATIPVVVDYDLPFVVVDPVAEVPEPTPVKIELVALPGTLTDENDFFNVTLIL